MKISDIKPAEKLITFLKTSITNVAIYGKDKPTSGLPDAYIEIYQNGATRMIASQLGFTGAYVIVSVSVKLLSTGGVNTVMEDKLLGMIDSYFENNRSLAVDNYEYALDANSTVYQGHGLYAGYSTKAFNLQVKIYKNS